MAALHLYRFQQKCSERLPDAAIYNSCVTSSSAFCMPSACFCGTAPPSEDSPSSFPGPPPDSQRPGSSSIHCDQQDLHHLPSVPVGGLGSTQRGRLATALQRQQDTSQQTLRTGSRPASAPWQPSSPAPLQHLHLQQITTLKSFPQ